MTTAELNVKNYRSMVCECLTNFGLDPDQATEFALELTVVPSKVSISRKKMKRLLFDALRCYVVLDGRLSYSRTYHYSQIKNLVAHVSRFTEKAYFGKENLEVVF